MASQLYNNGLEMDWASKQASIKNQEFYSSNPSFILLSFISHTNSA